MNTLARLVAFAASLALVGSPAGAGHLVSPGAVDRALEQAAAERTRDAARVDTLLAGEAAAVAASEMGVKIESMRAAAARLSDAERADLLARADALSTDPVAGYMDPDIKQLVMILLIVLIVVVVLDAVD